ncbi:MAG TPA: hypothetical protein GX016_03290 [Firmicutes bacterium]|nr:hypothetical protein [Bacillota bacterium]
MRRSRFWPGLLMGGLLGGIIGLASYPNLKPETKGRIIQAHQKMGRAKTVMTDLWRRMVRD